MEQILQIIPCPKNLKIINETYDELGNKLDIEDIVCLALIKNKDGGQEIRAVQTWGYGFEVMDRLTTVTQKEMKEEDATRIMVKFINEGE